jgi:hypothetical protein
MPITCANRFALKYIKHIEMTGVLMRVFSFSLVSWMGPASPFMFVWIFNTIDAVMLSWCALLHAQYFLGDGGHRRHSPRGRMVALICPCITGANRFIIHP